MCAEFGGLGQRVVRLTLGTRRLTLGGVPSTAVHALCPGAVDSHATTLDTVIAEIAASRLTERGATRADDKMSEAAMEDRKREGYF